MPIFVERAEDDYLTGQQIVEQLAAYLAGQYQSAETYLLEEIARRVSRDMNSDDPVRRVEAIRKLRAAAEDAIAAINSEELAQLVVSTAMREGEAAAIEQLAFTAAANNATAPAMRAGQTLPFATGLTPQAAIASAQIGLELSSALTDMNARILRAVPDLYQETVARFAGQRLLGVTTGRQARTRAVADFLSKGVTGITYSNGSRYSIGSYTEMATRTATNRAWLAAHEARWSSMGLNLVTIVRGSDACQACASWSGKILSLDGTTGTVEAEHATTGEPVTITIEGTLATARAGGWNHPNCRCTLAVVFPGLSLPADDTTYDPQAEKDRDRLRYLERRTRAFKQKGAIAQGLGDDVTSASYRRLARREQERIREHVAATGQVRKRYREAATFSGGAPTTIPPVRPLPIDPPKPPAVTRFAEGDLLRPNLAPNEAARRLAAGLDGQYGNLVLRIDVEDVIREGRGGYRLAGTVRDLDGNYAGDLSRSFFLDDEGTFVVHNNMMRLNAQYQGTGFSTEFTRRAEAFYRASGIDEVEVFAAMSQGGYAWARAGFGWDTSLGDEIFPDGGWNLASELTAIRNRMELKAEALVDAFDEDRADAIYAVTRRMREYEPTDSEFPTPFEIASLPDGAEILKGTSWHGRKLL